MNVSLTILDFVEQKQENGTNQNFENSVGMGTIGKEKEREANDYMASWNSKYNERERRLSEG